MKGEKDMSGLLRFKKYLMDNKEEIMKDKPSYHDIIKELTDDKEYSTKLMKLASTTIKMINGNINFNDFAVAIAMIDSMVDTMPIYLMEKYDLQFMKRK